MKRGFVIFLFLIVIFSSSISSSNVGLIEDSTWSSNLTGVRFPSISFGDIDNDGDDDMALVGCLTDGGNDCENGVIAKIYTNNGTTFTENQTWQQNLTGVGFGSVSFGDIDNDGDLDLGLLGCDVSASLSCTGNRIAKIYINNGTSFVENSIWQQNLTGTFNGVFTFGDIDNDGDLDIALVGRTVSSYIAKIYINNGTSFVENSIWQSNLTGIFQGEIILGDIDNDGDLDLALSGDTGSSKISKIYVNNGTSFVENLTWSQNLLGVDRGSLVFGDIDNDGDLDLDLIGQIAGDHQRVYLNNGITLVENQAESGTFAGLFRGCIAFGDYDNDGDLDLAAMGKEAGRARIYENNYTNLTHNNFVIDTLAHANISDDIIQCSLAWGDVDNDNDLDLLVSGGDAGEGLFISKVYINNNTISNTKPNASNSSFSSNYANNVLTLGWGNGSDSETPILGLYYNLMVGNSTQNHTIVSGVFGGSSNPTAGYFGNMMQRKNITLNVQLDANKTYYWYIQTIDTGLATSNWSTQQSFTTDLDVTKPNVTLEDPSPSNGFHTTDPIFIFNATVIDANLTNVTLFADFNGTLIANETNSSGLNGTYVFTKNLTDKNDNQYKWYIEACDSDSNCQSSGTRNFFLDRAAPVVTSISPASGSTSSSASVTFSYNVSDVDIANCSLIIDGSTDQTDSSITEDTTQNFTKSLSNGDYTWYVDCADYVGFTNSSISRSLTVSVSPGGNGGGGSGGGGTITFWTRTDSVNDEEFEKGYTQEVSEKQRLKISVNGETHYVGVVALTNTTATINITSDPIQVILSIGEEAKVDILDDGFYDLFVRLNNIVNQKANLTIKSIHEAIPEGEEAVVVSGEGEEEIEEEKVKKNRLLLGVVLIVAVIIIVFLSEYFLERYRNRFNHRVQIVEKKMGNKIILIRKKKSKFKKRGKNG